MSILSEKERKSDVESIKSTRDPPDGGRAWLVLLGCFCVSKKKKDFIQ
jgi:hypothetical protein